MNSTVDLISCGYSLPELIDKMKLENDEGTNGKETVH